MPETLPKKYRESDSKPCNCKSAKPESPVLFEAMTPDAQNRARAGSDRSFGLVFATLLAVVALYPAFVGGPIRFWALIAAAPFLVFGLFRPSLLRPLNIAWLRFGLLLGRVVNPLVMLVIYLLCILPIGLILKLAGKDLLKLRPDRTLDSYWIPRSPPGPSAESLEEQF